MLVRKLVIAGLFVAQSAFIMADQKDTRREEEKQRITEEATFLADYCDQSLIPLLHAINLNIKTQADANKAIKRYLEIAVRYKNYKLHILYLISEHFEGYGPDEKMDDFNPKVHDASVRMEQFKKELHKVRDQIGAGIETMHLSPSLAEKVLKDDE